jgi:glutamate racemase
MGLPAWVKLNRVGNGLTLDCDSSLWDSYRAMGTVLKHPNFSAPIGLFDSGLGGLTVLKELRKALPGEQFIYLGDSARAPYGSKSATTIRRYSEQCTEFLLTHQVKLMVVACNTASSLALEELSAICPCPVIGTIEPAVRTALSATRSGRIAVLGTRATVASGVYQIRLKELQPQLEIFALSCPLFVPLVEEGITTGPLVQQVVEMYLSEIRDLKVDTVILGCTHYPLLLESLQQFLGPEVALVECSKAIAESVLQLVGDTPVSGSNASITQYFVTDEAARFTSLARLFLGEESVAAVQVELSDDAVIEANAVI